MVRTILLSTVFTLHDHGYISTDFRHPGNVYFKAKFYQFGTQERKHIDIISCKSYLIRLLLYCPHVIKHNNIIL